MESEEDKNLDEVVKDGEHSEKENLLGRGVFESALDSHPMLAIIHDADLKILFLNKGALKRLSGLKGKYTKNNFLGSRITEFVSDDYAARLNARLSRVRGIDEPENLPIEKITLSDGSKMIVRITTSPITLSDGNEGTISYFEDVSAREETIEYLRRSLSEAIGAYRFTRLALLKVLGLKEEGDEQI